MKIPLGETHPASPTSRGKVISFGEPVVLVHGDSHYFRIDKPPYAEEGDESTGIPGRTEEVRESPSSRSVFRAV